jgi:DNA-binding HxlR family transcriptional regulator
MAIRNYEDLCGSARAMDTVGERWALLVIRELLLGPKRFADLSAGLPHASQSVLSQRLKELDSAGLIRRVKLGPPVSAHVYELTDAGRGLEPALLALARWGAILPAAPNATMSPDAFALGLRALYTPTTDDAFRATGEIRLGDDVFSIDAGPTGLAVRRGPVSASDFDVTGTVTEIWGVVIGGRPLAEAIETGAVSVSGDPTAAQEFFTRFPRFAAPDEPAERGVVESPIPS